MSENEINLDNFEFQSDQEKCKSIKSLDDSLVEQQNLNSSFQKKQQKYNLPLCESPYLQIYQSQFCTSRTLPPLNELKNRIAKYDDVVFRSEAKYPEEFSMVKIYESRNKRIMTFQVKFSYFITFVKVLNLVSKDRIEICLKSWISQGGFGIVYKTLIGGAQHAIKKIDLDPHLTAHSINNVIKEYCIMKTCGALEIGPKFGSIFGFDLVISQASIYFSCQFGTSVYDFVKANIKKEHYLQTEFSRLEDSLLTLHSFGICHNDIKPNNIVYSPSLKKLVFIDFGLSDVNCKLGFMRKEKAKGSIYYCCQDMKKLFFDSSSQGMVDLYYNDIVALSKSKQIIQTSKTSYPNETKEQIQYPVYEQAGKNHEFYDDSIQEIQRNIMGSQENTDQLESILMIKLMYLIHQKKILEFQKLAHEYPIIDKVLGKNLKKISFIFFQIRKNYSLELIYRAIKDNFRRSEQISSEADYFIKNYLDPYFSNQQFQELSEKGSKFDIEIYIQQQKQPRKIINQRFDQYFIHTVYGEDSDLKVSYKHIIIDSLQNTAQVEEYLITALQTFDLSQLLQLLISQLSKFELFFVWEEITQIQVSHFEQTLQKFKLKITFEIANDTGTICKIKISDKFVFYIKIFLNFYLQLIRQYNLKSMVGKLILEEIPTNSKINVEIFKSFFSLKNCTRQNNQQLDFHSNEEEQIQHFQRQSSAKFKICQFCLNVVDKLLKISDSYLNYQQNTKINRIFYMILDEKITEITEIYVKLIQLQEKNKSYSNFFVAAYFCIKVVVLFIQIMFIKYLNFRKRILSQFFARGQSCQDLKIMIQAYESLFFLLDKLKINQIFSQQQIKKSNLQEYIVECNQQMDILNKGGWYQMEKQLFKAIIYNSIVPFGPSQKFNLLKYFFKFIKEKEESKPTQIHKYAEYYFISSAYKLAIQVHDFTTLQKILGIIKGDKTYVMNMNFMSLMYHCYKRSNNSKKMKEYQKSLNSLKKFVPDNQAFYYQIQQNAILSSALSEQSSNKGEKNKSTKKNINQRIKQSSFNSKKRWNKFNNESQRYIRKEWQNTKAIQMGRIKSQVYLYKLRKILKDSFFSSKIHGELFVQMLKNYQVELQRYEKQIAQKISIAKQNNEIRTQIYKFFRINTSQQNFFWRIINEIYFILERSRLLTELTQNYVQLSKSKVDLILIQWQNFQSKIQQVKKQLPFNQGIIGTNLNLYYNFQSIFTKLKFRVQRVSFLNTYSEHEKQCLDSNKVKTQAIKYIRLFFHYVKIKLLNEDLIDQMPFNFHIKQTSLRNEKIKIEQTPRTVRCEESFISFMLDCFNNLINSSEVEDLMKNQKQLISFFGNNFDVEKQLKACFRDTINCDKVHILFELYHTRLNLIYRLIEISSMEIIRGEKQEEIDFYFLTYMFFHILKFVHRFNCSSYSYFTIGLINYFKKTMLGYLIKPKICTYSEQKTKKTEQSRNLDETSANPYQTLNLEQPQNSAKLTRKQGFKNVFGQIKSSNSDVFSTQFQQSMNTLKIQKDLMTINEFEKDLMKFLIEDTKQSKIIETITIFVSCERIKFDIIIEAFQTSKLHKFESSVNVSDLSFIHRIEYLICFNLDKLEFIAKSYLKHTLYCYLVMLSMANKKFQLFSSKFAENLAFSRLSSLSNKSSSLSTFSCFYDGTDDLMKVNFTLSTPTKRPHIPKYCHSFLSERKQRYFEIKFLRSTRKIIDRDRKLLQTDIQVQEKQKQYFSIFESVDPNSLIRIALKSYLSAKNLFNDRIGYTQRIVYEKIQKKTEKLIGINYLN